MTSNLSRISISIAIPTHDASLSLLPLVRNLLMQKDEFIRIVEIVILNDGGTSEGLEKLSRIRSRRISILGDSTHRGYSSRINTAIRVCRGDILVVMDSSLIPCSIRTIEDLSRPFNLLPHLSFATGAFALEKPQNLTQRALSGVDRSYETIRRLFRSGNSVYTLRELFFAIRLSTAKKTQIPSEIAHPHLYLYLSTRQHGYEVMYNQHAQVSYRQPSRLIDWLNNNISRIVDMHRLRNLFPKAFILKQFHIPFRLRISTIVRLLRRDPEALMWLVILTVADRISTFRNRTKISKFISPALSKSSPKLSYH